MTIPTDSPTLAAVEARSVAVRATARWVGGALLVNRLDRNAASSSPAINLRLSTMCEAAIHDSCGGHPVPQTGGATWSCRCLCHYARRGLRAVR